MRLWLSKNSSVPLREQLVRQLRFGVVSGDLKPGQRLPSTRELARRFRIHSNTVSAAFRDLDPTDLRRVQLRGDKQRGSEQRHAHWARLGYRHVRSRSMC